MEPTSDHDHENLRHAVTSRLHPRVHALVIGFAVWFALAVWSFAGSGVTDYLPLHRQRIYFCCGGAAAHFGAGRAPQKREERRQGALIARLGGVGFRHLGRPAQRHTSGGANSAAACGRGGRHDGDRHRVSLRRACRLAGTLAAQLVRPTRLASSFNCSRRTKSRYDNFCEGR